MNKSKNIRIGCLLGWMSALIGSNDSSRLLNALDLVSIESTVQQINKQVNYPDLHKEKMRVVEKRNKEIEEDKRKQRLIKIAEVRVNAWSMLSARDSDIRSPTKDSPYELNRQDVFLLSGKTINMSLPLACEAGQWFFAWNSDNGTVQICWPTRDIVPVKEGAAQSCPDKVCIVKGPEHFDLESLEILQSQKNKICSQKMRQIRLKDRQYSSNDFNIILTPELSLMLDTFNQGHYNLDQFYPGYPLKLGQILSMLMMQTWDYYELIMQDWRGYTQIPLAEGIRIRNWLRICKRAASYPYCKRDYYNIYTASFPNIPINSNRKGKAHALDKKDGIELKCPIIESISELGSFASEIMNLGGGTSVKGLKYDSIHLCEKDKFMNFLENFRYCHKDWQETNNWLLHCISEYTEMNMLWSLRNGCRSGQLWWIT